MQVLSKTYNTASGQLIFSFKYDDTISAIGDFSIIDMSELSHGFESADQRDTGIYPSNISITIDDFNGGNYAAFKTFITSYSSTYPFNHYLVLFLDITLNDSIIFRGILDELNSDNESKTLELVFIDGINKYKDVQIGNPFVLNYLNSRGLIPRSVYDIDLTHFAAAYGFGRIEYKTTTIIGEVVITPGYVLKDIHLGDQHTRLVDFVYDIVQLLKPGIGIDFSNQYKYGDVNVAIDDMADINQLRIRRIMSYLLGRYVVIPKVEGRYWQIGEVSSGDEYAKPKYFDNVYEDDDYRVYFHNWSGTPGSMKFEKGIDEKTIADILKKIAENTFSFFGFKKSNQFFFRHKRYTADAMALTGIMKMTKTLAIDRVDYVKIEDYYTDNNGSDGKFYNNSAVINYKIPFNTVRTAIDYEYRLSYYAGNIEKRVIYFYDPAINFKDLPMKVISRAEWEARKDCIDQYEFELDGINFEIDKTYSVNYENYQGKFRPTKIDINLLENKTTMTALEIEANG